MRNRYPTFWLPVLALCLLTFASVTRAQSTDQSNPTPITTNELTVTGPKKNNQQYYYSFAGGPGEVTIALNVKAKSSSTFVGIKVFDAELNTLTYHNMSADTSPSLALKKFDVGQKQTLVMSFTSDGSLGECKIKLGGAVEFGGGEMSSTGSDPATTQATEPSSTATSSTSGDLSSDQSSASKNTTFTMSILDAVGQRFNIPANGKLRIEMKDGSVQEIDLTQVKKILVKK